MASKRDKHINPQPIDPTIDSQCVAWCSDECPFAIRSASLFFEYLHCGIPEWVHARMGRLPRMSLRNTPSHLSPCPEFTLRLAAASGANKHLDRI